MICTEVGELMQRQLDYDLDEHELTMLMTHLSECIACKDLFERLTLLSGSLEQLPRVTPSINIVDSILPELDAIDRQRSSETKRNRYSRMRWMTTAASVAAAAAVVFIMSIGWNGSDSKDNVTYDVALSPETRTANPSDITPMYKSGDGLMDITTSTQSDAGQFSIEPMSSPSELFYNNMNTRDADSVEVHDQAGAKQSRDRVEGSQSIGINDESNDTASDKNDRGSFNNKELTPTNQGIMGIANVTESEEKESANTISSVEQAEQLKNYSPDEQAYILFDGHTIALYETSTNELLRSWEMSVTGTARLTVWDLESESFIYEVTDDKGKNYSFTININEQNE